MEEGEISIITIMKNITLEQIDVLNHQTILDYELANLYNHAKAHPLPRRRSDPVNTQIFIHNFDHKINLPPIHLSTTIRSKTKFEKSLDRTHKRNHSQFKNKRFQTLPVDMQCVSKFPKEQQKRKIVTSRETTCHKKQFIEVDMLSLMTWYAKNDLKNAKNGQKQQPAGKHTFQRKQQVKELAPIPTKTAIATFIQNYKVINDHINIDDLVRSHRFGVNHKETQFLYFGQIKKGRMDGKGIMITKNWIFEGIWNSSERVQGVQITPKGIYKGKFVNDERSKVGEFFWNNGQYYSGQWLKNKKHGTGVWKSVNGDVYMGQWIKGKVCGYGSHLTKQGQKYEGYFQNFLKHGQGKQSFPNGDFFEGIFKQGRPHGLGTYKWKNGITYQGQFKQGFREGKGVIRKLGIIYQGNFMKEKAEGIGKLTVINGDNYSGSFKKGKKQGKGIYKQDKKIYIGTWSNNTFIQNHQ